MAQQPLELAEFQFSHSGSVAPTRKKDGTIRMFAMPFGRPSVSPIMGDWKAQFQPEAFADWFGGVEAGTEASWVYADAHKGQPREALASVAVKEGPGSMSVYRDTHKGQDGIMCEFVPAETTAGRDISALVSSGVIDACSVGVYSLDDRKGWQKTMAEADKTGYLDISAKSVLPEISIVVKGGFSQARILQASGAHLLDYKKFQAEADDTEPETDEGEVEELADEVTTSGVLSEADRAWVLSAIREAVGQGLRDVTELNAYLTDQAEAENLGGTSENVSKVERSIWNTPF